MHTLPDGRSALLADPSAPLSISAGRVTLLDPGVLPEGARVEIVDQGAHGHVSVDTDGVMSLVFSEDVARTDATRFSYKVVLPDGEEQVHTQRLEFTASAEPQGWGLGKFYQLEQDEKGELVVEHGDVHRKVFVTAGDHGLTRADIAQREGVAESAITGDWLRAHGEYGASAETALAADVGMSLWYSLTSSKHGPNSHWLLFERGQEYDDLGRIINRGAMGESALHPQFVGAYGEGADPVLHSGITIFQNRSDNVVFQDLDVRGGVSVLGSDSENLLFDSMRFSKGDVVVKNYDGFTMQGSDIVDVAREEPFNATGDTWWASQGRISGLYLSGVEGALLRDNLFDHNGWADGYDYNLSRDAPMPPSYFNHNLYVQYTNLDVTIRDNVFLRGASFGAQMRPGGVIEGNAFIDNNAALNFFTGYNYTLVLDNVVTSAGYKKVSDYQGALSYGIDNFGKQTALIGNIVAHLADPDNAAEQAYKAANHAGLRVPEGNAYNDTIIYRWATNEKGFKTNPNTNIEGLDQSVLDATSIQRFTAQILGKETATISDLSEYLRGQADGALDGYTDADIIVAFFQKGFGLHVEAGDIERVAVFGPDARGDGMRWDNRLNWSEDALPGRVSGAVDGPASALLHDVDLAGNRVLFDGMTTRVDDLSFGAFGELVVGSGKLSVQGDLLASVSGMAVNVAQVTRSGQFWVDRYASEGRLDLDVDGGRFATTELFAGAADITVSEQGQFVMTGTHGRTVIADGSSLTIEGSAAKVGFDGEDSVLSLRLQDEAQVKLVADAKGLGQVGEIRSGAFDTVLGADGNADVLSGIKLGGTLVLDTSAWVLGTKTAVARVFSADEIVGRFSHVRLDGAPQDRDAVLVVDYDADTVVLSFGAPGSGTGAFEVRYVGEEAFVATTQDQEVLLADVTGTFEGPGTGPVVPAPEGVVLTGPEEVFTIQGDGDSGVIVRALDPAGAVARALGQDTTSYAVRGQEDAPRAATGGLLDEGAVMNEGRASADGPLLGKTAVDGALYHYDLYTNVGGLRGTSAGDVFVGASGADWFDAGAGNDTLFGGSGNDTLYGDAGADVLEGGAGDDAIFGGAGADRLVFKGDFGSDVVHGFEKGVDTLDIDAGAWDWALTADGVRVSGEGGSILFADRTLGDVAEAFGGFAPRGAVEKGWGGIISLDHLQEGVRMHALNPYSVAAKAISSVHESTYGVRAWSDKVLDEHGKTVNEYYTMNDGKYGAKGSMVADTILNGVLHHYDLYTDTSGMRGTRFDDEMAGRSYADTFFGNDGDDKLVGAGGDDWLYGERGSDRLYGGDGADHLFGGSGVDKLYGGSGNDHLFGGDGDDAIYGHAGHNVVRGGRGNDTITNLTPGGTVEAIFREGDGHDVLKGYVFGQDSLDIDSRLIERGETAQSFARDHIVDRGDAIVISFSQDESITILGSDATHQEIAQDIFSWA